MTYKPVDTAIVMVVGPCIDDTDFKTLEESIADNAAGMDVSLIVEKTDGTTSVTAITLTTGGTSDWTHKDGGYYEVEVTAAQNAEEGIAYIRGVCTGVLPFESPRYDIVQSNVYNSLITGTDKLEVDVVQVSGDTQSATDLKDFADSGYDPATNKVEGVKLADTTTTNTDMVGTDNAALAATALTNATWTDAKAAFLDHSIVTVDTNIDTLLARITAARAGYIDNLSAGAVALASGVNVTQWLGTAAATPTIAGVPEVDMTHIGGTAQTANDNGLDINDIKAALVPTTHCSTSGTVNIGSVFSGTHSNTCTDDTSYWTIQESSGTIDVELGFGIGENRVPTNMSCVMISPSAGGSLIFYAYNYLTSVWDKLNYATLTLPVLTGVDYRFSMLQDHVDTDGSVVIRIVSTGWDIAERVDIDMVNVRSINAGAITNGVQLGAQGELDVNAECDTALSDYDGPTNTEMVSAFTEIKGVTWAAGTDTLEHIRDKQTDIETDTAEIGTAGAGLTDLGGMSTGMKAEVNTEADTALTDYDPPTNAEMEARTLPSADYVVTTDTIAGVTTATNLTNAPTNGDLTATMKASVNSEVVDTLTVDTIADSYATDGSQPTIAQALLAIHQMMQEKSISGTTLTVKKPDGSTTAMTFTLDSATTPTSVTRST